MKLFDMLIKESRIPYKGIFVAAAISGLANSAILATVSLAAKTTNYEEINLKYFFYFIISMGLYTYFLRYAFDQSTRLFENAINNIRVRLTDKIRQSSLSAIEHIGKDKLHGRLTQELASISRSESILVASLQSAILVLFIAFYIAYLSAPAFFLVVGITSVGLIIYQRNGKLALHYIRRFTQREIDFFQKIVHLLDGFKEVKINRKRSDDLFEHLKDISASVKSLKIRTDKIYHGNYLLSQYIFYIMIGGVVFILPRLIPSYSGTLTEITMAILFIVGPLSSVVGAVPVLDKANVAVENIYRMEGEMNSYKTNVDHFEDFPLYFKRDIKFLDVVFSYIDRESQRLFTVGPLDLTIQQGEILFVIGGNGSGKSTFFKILTALYYPDSGYIQVDGVTLKKEAVQSYRELFSVIFSDFYLFDQLYGLSGIDEGKVYELLRTMDLHSKTKFVDNLFTNLELSTGQRKRLALLIALLEDKPIYIFDEWAAEQDPEFRRYFYEELLVKLKEQGKTIVAITHDDKYFHVADRVMKMEYGKIEYIVQADQYTSY